MGPDEATGRAGERYSRQVLLPQVGPDGQRRLGEANVTLIGCGALGSVLASTLVRAGVGHLRIVDRDVVQLSNLQRQTLFDEDDAAGALPKAMAAAQKLGRVNSGVSVTPHVADVHPGNILAFCDGATVILDGTDNLETRYLINDVAVKLDLPWVYGACVGTQGLVLPVLPRVTACLRCVWEEPPVPGSLPTCDTVGVLAMAVHVVASLQATEALKILLGRRDEVIRKLTTLDVWTGRVRQVQVQEPGEAGDCPCCGRGQYEFLSGRRLAVTTTLCGRNTVQVRPPECQEVDLNALAARLPAELGASMNEYVLRFRIEGLELTVFRDGRTLVQGTSDVGVARRVVATYVGS